MSMKNTELKDYQYDRFQTGQRIRKIRLLHDFSQDKFAESIDISSNFLCELENGRKGMSFDTLCRISECYHISTDYLLLGISEDSNIEHLEQHLCQLSDADVQIVIDYLQLLLKVRRLETAAAPAAEQDTYSR